MKVKKYSRELHLERTLVALGYTKALKALAFVTSQMNIVNGFQRHRLLSTPSGCHTRLIGP